MLKFRIIAVGDNFEKSGRRAILCQQALEDEMGFLTLGKQFHWEIDKSTLTPQMLDKLKDNCTKKIVIQRNFRLVEVTRQNPETHVTTIKTIAEPVE